MIIFNLILLNEINQTKDEKKFKVGDACNETFYEEGFICCNYSICDQYCYKNVCVQPKKIWFCTQIGILYSFSIKFLLSFIFFVFGVITRIYYHSSNQILFLLWVYAAVFMSDLILWCIFFGCFCYEFAVWSYILEIGIAVFILGLGFFQLFLIHVYVSNIIFDKKTFLEFSCSRPKSRIFGGIFSFFILIIAILFNFIIIYDFFMYILSNHHRKMWKKYIDKNVAKRRKDGSSDMQ